MRAPWTTMVTVALLLVFPSAAAATVCDERPPPTKAERFEARVKAGQAFRRQNGMPASRGHVVRVIRGPHERLPGFGVALWPREKRYMLRRIDTTGPGWDRLHRYVRRFPATFGGFSIGDDFPRGPAAEVLWTRRAHRRATEMRRLVAFPVRVRTVEHSERTLRRAQRRVDFDALSDEGISIRGVSVAVDRNRVLIEVISARPDAVERVEEHFGSLFIATVIARRASRLVCVRPDRATISADGLRLTLHYETNSTYDFERAFVAEEDDRVRVGAVERAPNGAVTLVAQTRIAKLSLSAPLGDRELVYAGNGLPLPTRHR